LALQTLNQLRLMATRLDAPRTVESKYWSIT